MPTGYTAELMKQEQTFSEFIMTCARAFGALIMMRDEPNDAPIPEKFEPTDYHAKCLIETQEKIIKLKSMTESEKIVFGETEKDSDIKRNEEWLERECAENKRLENMEAQVRAWKPPTQDHQGLKDFMLEQINISKNDLIYIQTLLVEAKRKPAIAYYVATISNAVRNIKYHTEENDKEIERVNKRNDWIRQLRESI